MINLLSSALPSKVSISNQSISINTDYRIWIDIWRIIDTPKPPEDIWKKAILIVELAYNNHPIALNNMDDAVEQAILFLERRDKADTPRPLTQAEKRLQNIRTFDWAYDANRVIADFEREYHIDLTNPDTHMHWWRFMALFNGLSDTSMTLDAIRVRAADLDAKGISALERKHLKERKQMLMLPARTREEAAQNSELRGL